MSTDEGREEAAASVEEGDGGSEAVTPPPRNISEV